MRERKKKYMSKTEDSLENSRKHPHFLHTKTSNCMFDSSFTISDNIIKLVDDLKGEAPQKYLGKLSI